MTDPAQNPEPSPADSSAARDSAQLSAWDAASLVVGIVIGTTIFKLPGVIAGNTFSSPQLFGLWALGGAAACCGALCYAELGATYRGAGGDYCYLTRAFGDWAGFLFGWTQFLVVQTVNIAMFSHVAAEYAWKLVWPRSSPTHSAAGPLALTMIAAGIVVCLTLVNLIGLRSGKRTQNLLSLAKLAGVALLILAGLLSQPASAASAETRVNGDWTIALIMILYAYGGWNDAAYVVTDIRDRQRNAPRALLLGVGVITFVYLAVNAVYVRQLGFAGLQSSPTPPVALMTAWIGDFGGRLMSLIIAVSALGAVNGLILSVSRLHAAVGQDHRLFSLLGRWSTRHDAPIGSLIVQALFTILLLLLVVTPSGRGLLDGLFVLVIGQPLPWSRFSQEGDEFSLLFAVGAPVFWTFFLATGISFFVLRQREPRIERPFRVPFYPLAPLAFCAMCGFGIFASVRYAREFTWLGVFAVLIGVLFYFGERLILGKPSVQSHDPRH